eukprot:TRINITY_DN43365_c0_g1_i1.p1 TRINITY_DN43365_c0_g1~~TRINITY_DN43365_c0_g1_i1.p1  ORF type:complete len:738 (-),score=164.58 TRINITY_DN43365_c0_g1_i1:156-2276(-)
MALRAAPLPLFVRQCKQLQELTCTVREVAGLAGLQAQEQRLQCIGSDLSRLTEEAASGADPTPSTAAHATPSTAAYAIANTSFVSVEPCMRISARDLRSSSDNTRSALQDLSARLKEAKESLSQLSRQNKSLRADVENSVRDSQLARTEACDAIAHAREVKSVLEAQDTRLRALAAEVQHSRELASDGFGRCNSNVENFQIKLSAEVSELREAFTCLEGKLQELQELSGADAGPAARQMQNLKDSMAGIQELRHSLEQRQGDLQAGLQVLREQLDRQQRDTLRRVQTEVLELRRGLETLQKQKGLEDWATDIAEVALVKRQQPNASSTRLPPVTTGEASSAPLPAVTEMPLAWRTQLEDVVRRAQWACEETRQGMDHKSEELIRTLKASWREVFDEQTKVCSMASKQASESLEAARLAIEMAEKSEDGISHRVGKLETDLRMHMQSYADFQERTHTSLRDGFHGIAKDLEETKASASSMGKVVTQLESLESITKELSSDLRQTQADLNEQEAKLSKILKLSLCVEALRDQVESVRSDMSMLDRYSRTEVAALAEALQGCLSRVDDTARHAAEQVAKKAVEVARRAASTECSAAVDEAARQAWSQGVASLDQKLAASIDQKVDQKLTELDKLATRLQEAAHGEVRACLAKGLEELRALRGVLEATAAQEARNAMEEKGEELLAFATKLQQLALIEVRQALEYEVGAR